jgi:molybdopterin converting factor small subunit
MANVLFSSGLRRYTGGEQKIRVEAGTVRELFAALGARYPELPDALKSMAVAIDGEIVNDPLLESLSPDAEVHFLPPIGGG